MKDPLGAVRRQIINDSMNAGMKAKGYRPVYTASQRSKIAIVGQAPGRKAQESHKPWNDPSGDTLRAWLGISRKDFYNPDNIALIPMDFYFPGKGKHGDLPPRKDFAPKWHPKLMEHMPNVKLIVVIGSYSQEYYLADKAKRNLTETVKAYKEYLPEYFPLVHPSPLNMRWRKRNPWFESEVVPQLRQVVSSYL